MTRALGIDDESGLVYIGNMWNKWQLHSGPLPPAAVFHNDIRNLQGPTSRGGRDAKLVFQECDFESVARIRRGFLWTSSDRQPMVWRLDGRSGPESSFATYFPQSILGIVGGRLPEVVLLTFGSPGNFAIGELVHLEAQADGRELLTIRMRDQFRLLPNLRQDVLQKLEPGTVIRLEKALENVIAGFRSSPPISVVDRCRDALTVILQVLTGNLTKDIAKLVDLHENGERTLVGDLAHSVARLHARAKPAEAHRKWPSVGEREAELALVSVGVVLVSLKWADWSE